MKFTTIKYLFRVPR